MSTVAPHHLTEIATQWRIARRLYALYGPLQQRFDLGVARCPELESPINKGAVEVIDRIWTWFDQMDAAIHVHQLRQLLQTSPLGTEENLRAIITRYMEREEKTDADRDKLDFLLVQYLGSCAPPGFYDKEVTFDDCAQALEPVLGEVGIHPPRWTEPLEKALADLENCESLRDLLSRGILEDVREVKVAAGEMYFGPTALVASTRFNFLARRSFVRMIAADLHAIRSTLRDLEVQGVKTVDCAKAGLSPDESVPHLRELCHDWKKAFHAAYAAGQSFKQLVDVRTAVEDALAGAITAKQRRDLEEKEALETLERHQKESEEYDRLLAEEQARRAEEESKRKAEEERLQQAEAERLRGEAEETARQEAEEKTRLEEEERQRVAEAERVRQEEEERARKEAEEKALRDAEEEARRAEEERQRQAEAAAKQKAAEDADNDEYERAVQAAEATAQREAEEKARIEAERKAAEEKARLEAEEQARHAEAEAKREAEEKERLAEEARQKQAEKERLELEALEEARKEAEAKDQREEEERRQKAEQESRELEALEAARKEADAKAQQEQEERLRLEKEAKEAAELAELEELIKAEEEAAAKAKAEAEDQQREQEERAKMSSEELAALEEYERAVQANEVAEAAKKAKPAVAKNSKGSAAATAPAKSRKLENTEAWLSAISTEVKRSKPKGNAVTSMILVETTVMLSSWEAAAFQQRGNPIADALCAAVAARAMLVNALACRKQGDAADVVRTALWQAQTELGKAQTQVAAARDANDIDAAVNLAATAKRLQAVMDEANQPSKRVVR